ncbi:hypothetical protein BDV59DRAFT_171056 [Aspergillus ambiguus]|uniref:uncharacterized protein n=1 Tax=Aspergillus ambiguus TaxID=176160 RepID=UPI003CCD4222
MQFKSILLLAASASLAVANFDVGNCGDSNQAAINTSGGKDGDTQKACDAVKGHLCSGTGVTKCVVEVKKWHEFEKVCGDKKAFKQFKNIGDEKTAERQALCLGGKGGGADFGGVDPSQFGIDMSKMGGAFGQGQ